jgi:hypothetical protein
MTRDEVGALALIAINDTPATGWSNEWLMRFAELVAERERESIAEWVGDIQIRINDEWVPFSDAVRARGKSV